MKLSYLTLVATFTAATAFAGAQTGTTTTPPTVTGKTIAERKVNQQDRIEQGLRSGQLTAAEASTLETQEAGINSEEHGMRQQDNGKLTTADKTLLNSQQNTESKDIYADKHNDSIQPTGKGELTRREDNQQDRIANGLASDKLTDSQTAHLEKQEAGIDTEESGMKAQDNGKLTAADRKTLNHQLNQESRRINRDERRTTRRR